MKIAGIIAEYNPFHTGHAYHIQKTRKITGADYIIVVMSGDFVQRGGPAFLPKHQRAKMALLGGADLVFELPSTHSCQSAEYFARSGVQLLDGLGCVDYLSFGSESGEIAPLKALGDYLAEEPEAFRKILQEELKSGMSFPAARRNALLSVFGSGMDSLLTSPNNILGIEYCKALHLLKSPMQPLTIPREGSGYHEKMIGDNFPSASAIRHLCLDSHRTGTASIPPSALSSGTLANLSSCFPPEVFTFISAENLLDSAVTEQDYSLLIRWLLMNSDTDSLASYQDISRNLAQRLIKARNEYQDFSQFVSLIKTKEMTYTRICRALFHALLEIRDVPPLSYARLLGFRQSASLALTAIKKKASLPLLTKLADAESQLDAEGISLLNQNTRISNLYETVLCEKTRKPFTHEYRKPLVILPS